MSSTREILLKRLKQGIPSSLLIEDPVARKYCEALREIVTLLVDDQLSSSDRYGKPVSKKMNAVAQEADKKTNSPPKDKGGGGGGGQKYTGVDSVEVFQREIHLKNDMRNPPTGFVYSSDQNNQPRWEDVFNLVRTNWSVVTDFANKSISLDGDKDLESLKERSQRFIYTVGNSNKRRWMCIDNKNSRYVKLEENQETKNLEFTLVGSIVAPGKTPSDLEDKDWIYAETPRSDGSKTGWKTYKKPKSGFYVQVDVNNHTVDLKPKGSGEENSDEFYSKSGWKKVPAVLPKSGIYIKVDETNNTIDLDPKGSGDTASKEFYSKSGWQEITVNPPQPATKEIEVITGVEYSTTTHELTVTKSRVSVLGATQIDKPVTVFTATAHWKEHETA